MKVKMLLLVLVFVFSCSKASKQAVNQSFADRPTLSSEKLTAPRVSKFDLLEIDHFASKGRVQDKEYNPDLDVIDQIISGGIESIPILISTLDNNTKTEKPVVDFWSYTTVGDISLIILTDLFTDSSWTRTTIPEIGWDDILERDRSHNITSEEVLRGFIKKRGREAIKTKWQQIWNENKDRVYWDENERCFKLKAI